MYVIVTDVIPPGVALQAMDHATLVLASPGTSARGPWNVAKDAIGSPGPDRELDAREACQVVLAHLLRRPLAPPEKIA